jgi:hypothetical protein
MLLSPDAWAELIELGVPQTIQIDLQELAGPPAVA